MGPPIKKTQRDDTYSLLNNSLQKRERLNERENQEEKQMIIYHFSVYDEITCLYNLPFQAHNINDAKRIFTTALHDPSTKLHQHPADYSLYYVATYDNETGTYINNSPKELILKGSQIALEEN